MALEPLIDLDEAKCVNCHACIAACPVKFCNDATGDAVKIRHDTCIGCGECIKACTHQARLPKDDTTRFFQDLAAGVPMITIAAPAIASSFPGQYLNFNGWLASLGVKAAFDVSFGAELTVRSYLDHVQKNSPQLVIAQPCPAIVNFIELNEPRLLPHLAPADSPMLHIMKMIRRKHPEYARHKIAVLSPCVAKKREFLATGHGDYNVTMSRLREEIKARNIDLSRFPEVDYANPPAERAVLFSTPGGLLRTAERWNPAIGNVSRKIEGPHTIYEYLHELADHVGKPGTPLLVDCLNCELGCNAGTGTDNTAADRDRIEHHIEERNRKMVAKHRRRGPLSGWRTRRSLHRLVEKSWAPGVFGRSYVDRSASARLRIPTPKEKEAIFASMGKYTEKDVYNCNSCGYGRCEDMAKAIHNGLNKPENCHHYLQTKCRESSLRMVEERVAARTQVLEEMESFQKEATLKLESRLDNASRSMSEMSSTIREIARNTEEARNATRATSKMAENVSNLIGRLEASADEISNVTDTISQVAGQTQLLALNAKIESARAGEAGRGFSVVADEVKQLARSTAQSTGMVGTKVAELQGSVTSAVAEVRQIVGSIDQTSGLVQSIAAAIEQQSNSFAEVARDIEQVSAYARDTAQQVRKMAAGD